MQEVCLLDIEVVTLDQRERAVAEGVVSVQRAAYAVEAAIIGYDRMPGLLEGVDDVMRLPLTLLGAKADGRLAGVLGFTVTDSVVEIDRLVVHPTHFRRGVGGRLVSALHDLGARAERFEVSTGTDNAPAVSLYLAMGYECTGTELSDGVALSHFTRQVRGR